jgi:prevent-host-death family protein
MPTRIVNTHEAKSRLSELIREAEQGHDVIVARNGHPVAKIIAWPPAHPDVLGGDAVGAGDRARARRGRVPRRADGGAHRQRVRGLPISAVHAERAAVLPPHHRDPFDRMLVAQAQIEELVLVTADRSLQPYDVELLDAQS